MKKIGLFLTIVLAVLLTMACKSRPQPIETTRPEPPPPVPAQEPDTNSSQQSTTVQPPSSQDSASTQSSTTPAQSGNTGTYNRHSSGIILDGASNYTVIKGDTLNGIARQLYHDGSLYPLIMMISDNVDDPDEIEPGLQLIIPNVNVNMNDPTARQSINRYFLDIARIEDQRERSGTAELIRNHTR